MAASKIFSWTVTILFFLFLFWLAGLLFNIGFGIVGIALSLVTSILGLVFSKNFFVLLAVGLVIFLLINRSKHRSRCPYKDCN